ncbi:MAG: hypothetical protein IT210_11515 [Armatimonadetes bacterium]|nr:hypothetical protein [Armatimonadota bacterium]
MWEDLEDFWKKQERLIAQMNEEEKMVQAYLDYAVADLVESTGLAEDTVRKILTAWESSGRMNFLGRVFELQEEKEAVARSSR